MKIKQSFSFINMYLIALFFIVLSGCGGGGSKITKTSYNSSKDVTLTGTVYEDVPPGRIATRKMLTEGTVKVLDAVTEKLFSTPSGADAITNISNGSYSITLSIPSNSKVNALIVANSSSGNTILKSAVENLDSSVSVDVDKETTFEAEVFQNYLKNDIKERPPLSEIQNRIKPEAVQNYFTNNNEIVQADISVISNVLVNAYKDYKASPGKDGAILVVTNEALNPENYSIGSNSVLNNFISTIQTSYFEEATANIDLTKGKEFLDSEFITDLILFKNLAKGDIYKALSTEFTKSKFLYSKKLATTISYFQVF